MEPFEPFRKDLLSGKTTIITGGGTGLGRSMALRMAGLGAKVGIVGRRPAPLEETVAAIRKAGGQGAFAPADIREPEAVGRAVDALESELGPASQLVNNAAGNFLAASEDLSPNAFNSVVQIVLYGSFHCTRELGRRLIERQQTGEILSIVTSYAQTGSAFVLPSAVAKAGVLGDGEAGAAPDSFAPVRRALGAHEPRGLSHERREPVPDGRPRDHRRRGGALLRPAVRGLRAPRPGGGEGADGVAQAQALSADAASLPTSDPEPRRAILAHGVVTYTDEGP